MYATDRRQTSDRQTDIRHQTKALLNAPAYIGAGHNKRITVITHMGEATRRALSRA